MVELLKPAEQEIRERMPAAGRTGCTSVLAVGDKVPSTAEVVVDLRSQILKLGAELYAVPPFDPVRLVVELESVSWE